MSEALFGHPVFVLYVIPQISNRILDFFFRITLALNVKNSDLLGFLLPSNWKCDYNKDWKGRANRVNDGKLFISLEGPTEVEEKREYICLTSQNIKGRIKHSPLIRKIQECIEIINVGEFFCCDPHQMQDVSDVSEYKAVNSVIVYFRRWRTSLLTRYSIAVSHTIFITFLHPQKFDPFAPPPWPSKNSL